MELADRFRGYLPVVVDLETGGFNSSTNPLLEIACAFLTIRNDQLVSRSQHAWCVEPFEGSEVDPASLKVTGIDLEDPNRRGLNEADAVADFFKLVRQQMKQHSCNRAIMVAHNAAFDHGFLHAVCNRCNINRSPFHPFSTIDTASLAAVAYGHTVLSEACKRAGIEFSAQQAHSAAYDTACTTELFCQIVNAWPYRNFTEGGTT
ncbi:MAG: ribonuclease T [Pseudomonadota bacterium]